MGNGQSNRRTPRNPQNSVTPTPPRMIPPPPGYPGSHAPHPGPPPYPSNGHLPYIYPANYNGGMTAPIGPQYYPPGYMPSSNGQYMMNLQQQGSFRAPNPAPAPAAAETQKTNTIRNDVNLKKATLRLERDEENPGFHLMAFSFDATVAGSISIFYLTRERDGGLTPIKPNLYKASRVMFEQGYGQKFRQAPGSGVNLSMFDERELTKEGDESMPIYPVVVRMEAIAKDHPSVSLQDEFAVGAPLPSWVHCQTTHGVLEKKDDDGNYKVRVNRQTIWVDGIRYELQEIYGIESSGGGNAFDGNDAGKECVICMSEPRDTTVLPCRHMCMCGECAKVLRFQTNRCPICRTPVEKLLEIKVPKNDSMDMISYGAASQSSTYAGQSSGESGTRTSTLPHLDLKDPYL